MNIETQVDAETQISIKLDQIDAVLAIMFDYFHPETSLDSIPNRHFVTLANSAMEDLAEVRAMLDVSRILSSLQEAM